MMEFTPQPVTVSFVGVGDQVIDEAIVSGPFAVHHMRLWTGKLDTKFWGVTHLPTGKSITQFIVSESAARRLCETIAPLSDWTSINVKEAVQGDPDKMAAVNLAIRIAVNETCWVRRDEVEPEYQDPCAHTLCIEDIRLHELGHQHEWSDWECPSGMCLLDRSKAECVRESGHDSLHQWAHVAAPVLGELVALPTPPVAVPS